MFKQNSILGNFLLFIGRVLISQIFIIAGFSKLLDFQHTATLMTSMGIPASEFMLVVAIIFELGGGLLLLFGLYTRLGVVLLFVFVILVTYYFHSYWDYQAAAKVTNMQHFMKNLTIVGGLFYVYVCGAGQFSLDVFRKKK